MNATAFAVSPRPAWFKIVAVLALLWNLVGVAAFAMDAMMTPESIAALPDAQQQLYAERPGWVMVAYGVAVLAGALGSLTLLLGKRLALPLLVLSFVAVLAQMSALFTSATFRGMGTGAMAFPVLVVVIAGALAWLARTGVRRGWLA